jgi:crossover junction endodeoxyribonuclease RuvC
MIIIGIDPGTATTGYGVIENRDNKLKMIDYGCIRTSAKTPNAQRLFEIDQKLIEIMNKHKPNQVAVEDLFFFKNLKTAIKVSQARGVVLSCVARANLTAQEYTPLQVKQAVASYGRAEKQQVQYMVKLLLNLKQLPKPDDAADALAVAICCAHSTKF